MGECCQDERQPIAEQGARAAVNITPCRPLQEDFRPLMQLHEPTRQQTQTAYILRTTHGCIHHRVRSQAFLSADTQAILHAHLGEHRGAVGKPLFGPGHTVRCPCSRIPARLIRLIGCRALHREASSTPSAAVGPVPKCNMNRGRRCNCCSP